MACLTSTRESMTSKMVGASNASVRKPCATVPPNGPSFAARSTSTWIHWRSSVQCANSLMRCWSTTIHDETPMTSPMCALRSAGFNRSMLMPYSFRWLSIEEFVDRKRRLLGAGDQEQVPAIEHLHFTVRDEPMHQPCIEQRHQRIIVTGHHQRRLLH